jgi:hypothetical protein
MSIARWSFVVLALVVTFAVVVHIFDENDTITTEELLGTYARSANGYTAKLALRNDRTWVYSYEGTNGKLEWSGSWRRDSSTSKNSIVLENFDLSSGDPPQLAAYRGSSDLLFHRTFADGMRFCLDEARTCFFREANQ